MQDPHVDIAMFCIYSMYEKEQVDRLIGLYFGRETMAPGAAASVTERASEETAASVTERASEETAALAAERAHEETAEDEAVQLSAVPAETAQLSAVPAETVTKIYALIAACGLLWSNWCEYKQHLGVEFGEYSLRQYRYAKEYYRYAVERM